MKSFIIKEETINQLLKFILNARTDLPTEAGISIFHQLRNLSIYEENKIESPNQSDEVKS